MHTVNAHIWKPRPFIVIGVNNLFWDDVNCTNYKHPAGGTAHVAPG